MQRGLLWYAIATSSGPQTSFEVDEMTTPSDYSAFFLYK